MAELLEPTDRDPRLEPLVSLLSSRMAEGRRTDGLRNLEGKVSGGSGWGY